MRLKSIQALSQAFGVEIGLSDHTLGSAVSVASIALGATVIEKHMTLKRADGGPDAAFSLEPQEFKTLVEDCKTAHAALGEPNYQRQGGGSALATFRRSLYAVSDIKTGETFTHANTRSIRPGNGLPPKHLPEILGQTATRDIARGEPLDWSLIKRS